VREGDRERDISMLDVAITEFRFYYNGINLEGDAQ
jgi:hypothetical protein